MGVGWGVGRVLGVKLNGEFTMEGARLILSIGAKVQGTGSALSIPQRPSPASDRCHECCGDLARACTQKLTLAMCPGYT